MTRTKLAAVLAAALLLVASPNAGHAVEPDVHPDIAYALQVEPGGVATSYNTAEWPDFGMTLVVPAIETLSVGSCPTGYICAYQSAGQAGTRLQWDTCGSKATAALGNIVGSIANARSSGTLHARQGTTSRASAGAGTYSNVPLAYRQQISSVYC